MADLPHDSANGKTNGSVYGINEYSHSISSNVTVVEGVLSDIAVNPVTNAVYVAVSSNDNVYVIDSSGIVMPSVKVGRDPVSVAINPSNNMVYVANEGSNTVSVIDGNTNKVIHEIDVSGGPRAVAVNSKTNTIYVTNVESRIVSVIDGNTNKVTGTIPVGDFPAAIAVNQDTNLVYVANRYSNTISIINGATGKVTAEVITKVNPPNAGEIYRGNKLLSNYTRYDLGTQLECKAIGNNGYQFSSWSTDLHSISMNNPGIFPILILYLTHGLVVNTTIITTLLQQNSQLPNMEH